jgi:hypothetical protein
VRESERECVVGGREREGAVGWGGGGEGERGGWEGG